LNDRTLTVLDGVILVLAALLRLRFVANFIFDLVLTGSRAEDLAGWSAREGLEQGGKRTLECPCNLVDH
jgi:hypothetical protein